MADPTNPPPGECPQCWRHAYDKSIYARLKPGQDCPECVDHLKRGCPYVIPKKSMWW